MRKIYLKNIHKRVDWNMNPLIALCDKDIADRITCNLWKFLVIETNIFVIWYLYTPSSTQPSFKSDAFFGVFLKRI